MNHKGPIELPPHREMVEFVSTPAPIVGRRSLPSLTSNKRSTLEPRKEDTRLFRKDGLDQGGGGNSRRTPHKRSTLPTTWTSLLHALEELFPYARSRERGTRASPTHPGTEVGFGGPRIDLSRTNTRDDELDWSTPRLEVSRLRGLLSVSTIR